MAIRPVATTVDVGTTRVHLFQVVREHRPEGDEDWVVVGLDADSIALASLSFEWHHTVPPSAFESGAFQPLSADGVPVWGY